MYFDGPELVKHYREWLETNKEAIEAKLVDSINQADPKQALQDATNAILNDILPMALAEMMLFNNSKLKEYLDENLDGGCSNCTVIK